MKVTNFAKLRVIDYTGQPDHTPYLYGIAYFSDTYHAAFDFDPRTRKITMRRKDGKGWTYNDRPSRARIEAILAVIDPQWRDALKEAERLHAEQVAWQQKRAAYFIRRSAAEPLHEACIELVRAAREGGSFDDAIRKATDALAVAAGRDRREFIVTDRTNPGLTHRARHSTIDLALTEFLMGREKPPVPNSIIIRAAD